MPPGRAGSAKLGGSQADAPGGGPGRVPRPQLYPQAGPEDTRQPCGHRFPTQAFHYFFLIGLIGRISPQAGCALSRGVTLPCTPLFSRAHGHAREQTTSPACPHAFGKGRASASN